MSNQTLQTAIAALESATRERDRAAVELEARNQEVLTAQRACGKAIGYKNSADEAVNRAQKTLNAVLESIK